ncbi:MAG: hypothetical protein RL661_21 [Pseudomonadota bacterium]
MSPAIIVGGIRIVIRDRWQSAVGREYFCAIFPIE